MPESGSALRWWSCNSILSSPLLLTSHHDFLFSFMEVTLLFFHPWNWGPQTFKASPLPKKMDFSGSLKMKGLETIQNSRQLSSGRWGGVGTSLSALRRGSGVSQTTKDQEASYGVGVWTRHCAGGGCLAAPHVRIVSQLRNGLNWPAMVKFTTGSAGAAGSNLEVSPRKSATLLFLPLN